MLYISFHYVTTKSSSVGCGGGAGHSDGEFITLWSETQDVAMFRLKLQHHSPIANKL